MRHLEDVLTALGVDLEGFSLTAVSAISHDGRHVAGSARNAAGDYVNFVATIPEPSTALLVGVGLLALARRSTRR